MINIKYNYLIGRAGAFPSNFNIENRIDPDSICKELYDDIIIAFFDDVNENSMNGISSVENWKQQYKKGTPFYTIRVNKDKECILLSSDYIGPSVCWAEQKGVSSENIRYFLSICRTIGGHMVWPRGKDVTGDGTLTINQARGGDKGIYDRIDWMLLLIKIYYSFREQNEFFEKLNYIFDSKQIDKQKDNFLRIYRAVSRAHEVLFYKFESFERFCKQFKLNGSFVDEKFYVKKMADWFPILPDVYMDYINNICQAVRNRNCVIAEKCNNSSLYL